MKNFAKRISALVLAVVVSAAVLCPAAFAAQLPSLPKGECVVDDAGVLSSSTVQTITDLNAQLESIWAKVLLTNDKAPRSIMHFFFIFLISSSPYIRLPTLHVHE